MPLIEKNNSSSNSRAAALKTAQLLIGMSLILALIGILYHKADSLYQTVLQQAEAAHLELAKVQKENETLKSDITGLLKKLTRLNELYSSSIKKTSLRVDNIESSHQSTAQKLYETLSMNNYLAAENRQLEWKVLQCQKKLLSSSSFSTDANDPNIQRERIE